MKALVNTASNLVEWLDRTTPVAGAGQPRIRTVACGICATDLEMIRGWERTAQGAIRGHAGGMRMGITDAARADYSWNTLLHKELELVGTNASACAWPEAVRLATTGAIPLARLISRRMPAERGQEAIDLVRRSTDLIKVVLDWKA